MILDSDGENFIVRANGMPGAVVVTMKDGTQRAFVELQRQEIFAVEACHTCDGEGWVHSPLAGSGIPVPCRTCNGIGLALQRLPKEGGAE